MLRDRQRKSPGSKGRTASIGALGRRSFWPMTAKQWSDVLGGYFSCTSAATSATSAAAAAKSEGVDNNILAMHDVLSGIAATSAVWQLLLMWRVCGE